VIRQVDGGGSDMGNVKTVPIGFDVNASVEVNAVKRSGLLKTTWWDNVKKDFRSIGLPRRMQRYRKKQNTHTGQPAPAPPVKNWRILLKQSFSVHMPLLMTTSTFELRRRC